MNKLKAPLLVLFGVLGFVGLAGAATSIFTGGVVITTGHTLKLPNMPAGVQLCLDASSNATPCPGGAPATPIPPAAHVPTAVYCCGGSSNDTPVNGPSTTLPFVTYYANPNTVPCGGINGSPACSGPNSNPGYGAQGLQAAGVAPQNIYLYVDGSRVYNVDADYSKLNGGVYAAARARTCANAVVTVAGSTGLLSDPWSPTTTLLYQDIIQGNGLAGSAGGTGYNATSAFGKVFLDDIEAYYYSDNTPCHGGSSWLTLDQTAPYGATAAQFAALVSSLTISTLATGQLQPQYIVNGLGSLTWPTPSDAQLKAEIAAMINSTNICCMMGEVQSQYASVNAAAVGNDTNNASDVPNEWYLTELATIQLVNAGKIAWIYNQNASATGATAAAGRIYTLASFLLTWDPALTVLQGIWYGAPGDSIHLNSTNPQLHVFPEEMLTAYSAYLPYPSTAAGIDALKDSGGAYFREYANCFVNKTSTASLSGPTGTGCVVVVNPNDGVTHARPTFAHGPYNHTLSIGTGTCTIGKGPGDCDVLNGGTVLLNGSAIPSTLAAGPSAYIGFP